MSIEITSEFVAKNAQEFPLLDASALRGGMRSVASKAAAIALDARKAAEGGFVYVGTYRRIFRTVLDGAQTPVDGKILQGSGFQLVALDIPDPLWTEQGTYYISAASGDEEATGLLGAPVKTIDEVMRRVNRQTFGRAVRVVVLDGDVGDMHWDVGFDTVNTVGVDPYQLSVVSAPASWTTLASGTLAAGTLSLSAAAQQVNTLVCNDLVDSNDQATVFDASMLHGRVRITSGAQAGAVAHIDKILSGTSVTTKIFQIFGVDADGYATGAVTGFDRNPASGATFVVETTPRCGTVSTIIRRDGRKSDLTGIYGFVLDSFDMGGNATFPYAGGLYLEGASSYVQMNVQRSLLRYANAACSAPVFARLQGCTIIPDPNTAGATPIYTGFYLYGGGATGNGVYNAAQGILLRPNAHSYWGSYNFIARALSGAIICTGIGTGGIAAFDSAGDGMWIKPLYAGHRFVSTTTGAAGPVWGNNNAGYGIVMDAGGQVIYNATKPTLTGLLGDTLVGGTDVPYSAHPTMRADKLCGMAAY